MMMTLSFFPPNSFFFCSFLLTTPNGLGQPPLYRVHNVSKCAQALYSIFSASFDPIMAEKRRLPARERRESAAKRRASEAAPQTPSQAQPSSSRKKGSTPGVASTATSTPPLAPPEPVAIATPLPTKIKDGEGLPTVSTPQKSTLSDKEYQSIAERYFSRSGLIYSGHS